MSRSTWLESEIAFSLADTMFRKRMFGAATNEVLRISQPPSNAQTTPSCSTTQLKRAIVWSQFLARREIAGLSLFPIGPFSKPVDLFLSNPEFSQNLLVRNPFIALEPFTGFGKGFFFFCADGFVVDGSV